MPYPTASSSSFVVHVVLSVATVQSTNHKPEDLEAAAAGACGDIRSSLNCGGNDPTAAASGRRTPPPQPPAVLSFSPCPKIGVSVAATSGAATPRPQLRNGLDNLPEQHHNTILVPLRPRAVTQSQQASAEPSDVQLSAVYTLHKRCVAPTTERPLEDISLDVTYTPLAVQGKADDQDRTMHVRHEAVLVPTSVVTNWLIQNQQRQQRNSSGSAPSQPRGWQHVLSKSIAFPFVADDNAFNAPGHTVMVHVFLSDDFASPLTATSSLPFGLLPGDQGFRSPSQLTDGGDSSVGTTPRSARSTPDGSRNLNRVAGGLTPRGAYTSSSSARDFSTIPSTCWAHAMHIHQQFLHQAVYRPLLVVLEKEFDAAVEELVTAETLFHQQLEERNAVIAAMMEAAALSDETDLAASSAPDPTSDALTEGQRSDVDRNDNVGNSELEPDNVHPHTARHVHQQPAIHNNPASSTNNNTTAVTAIAASHSPSLGQLRARIGSSSRLASSSGMDPHTLRQKDLEIFMLRARISAMEDARKLEIQSFRSEVAALREDKHRSIQQRIQRTATNLRLGAVSGGSSSVGNNRQHQPLQQRTASAQRRNPSAPRQSSAQRASSPNVRRHQSQQEVTKKNVAVVQATSSVSKSPSRRSLSGQQPISQAPQRYVDAHERDDRLRRLEESYSKLQLRHAAARQSMEVMGTGSASAAELLHRVTASSADASFSSATLSATSPPPTAIPLDVGDVGFVPGTPPPAAIRNQTYHPQQGRSDAHRSSQPQQEYTTATSAQRRNISPLRIPRLVPGLRLTPDQRRATSEAQMVDHNETVATAVQVTRTSSSSSSHVLLRSPQRRSTTTMTVGGGPPPSPTTLVQLPGSAATAHTSASHQPVSTSTSVGSTTQATRNTSLLRTSPMRLSKGSF